MGEHDEHIPDGADAEIEATVTLHIRITDWDALRMAAIGAVHGIRFEGQAPEQQRSDMLDEVGEGPQGALNVLLDPDQLLQGIPGVELLGGAMTTQLVDAFEPDFAELFPLDDPRARHSGGWLLTPRTACLLSEQLSALADAAYDDVEEYDSTPIVPGEDHEWAVLGRLPRLTWQQDGHWRRLMARAFDDLADDLATGLWPQPRSPAEQKALHLALTDAAAALEDEPDHIADLMDALPADPFDYDWETCGSVFLPDARVLMLDDPSADGIEDPESESNRQLGIGDLRPSAWFSSFDDAEPRDPERGFRR